MRKPGSRETGRDKVPKNLLFIFSDQHAARVAGCYGDPLAETPALDRLAAEGVTFEAAYCPSPICGPSRMSQMTARYPHRTRVWGNEDILSAGIPTFAHSLGAAGLTPHLVGRLHALGPDQLLGYTRREIGDHHANWLGVPRVDLGPLEGTASPDRRSLLHSGIGQSPYEIKDEDVTEAALARLEALAHEVRDGLRDRFSMTVGFMLPHAPFVARADDFRRFEGRIGLARQRRPDPDKEHPWLAAWRTACGVEDVTEAEEIRARTAYYALVASMDRMIGRILDQLDALGLADDTLVVYSSDHGEQIGAHGHWWKHTFYEDSVRVPMILRWPAGLPRGERRSLVVNLVDLTATMLDAMGAPALPGACGTSFLDAARDPTAPWLDQTFSEYCHGSRFAWGVPGTSQNRMLRQGRFKLCYYHGHPPQLFDLEEDPLEQNDLADNARYAAVRQSLTETILSGWNPAEIERQIEDSLPAKALLADWASATRPSSAHFWNLLPEHCRLDGVQ
ncbi:MAG: sulfatase-like hydrolase/transferase [Roseovarius confluentis]